MSINSIEILEFDNENELLKLIEILNWWDVIDQFRIKAVGG